jgi:hypothetical protein
MIEDMTVRGFNEDTRRDYVRHVRAFAVFMGRSPDTATAEDLRLFQLHETQSGIQPPSINSAVSALRFLFTVTVDRPDLVRRLTVVPYPRRIPAVLSAEEVTLLLRAATAPKYGRGSRPPEPVLGPAKGRTRGAPGCACRRLSRSRSAILIRDAMGRAARARHHRRCERNPRDAPCRSQMTPACAGAGTEQIARRSGSG